MKKNKVDWVCWGFLHQIVCPKTGHMAGILGKCMAVWILFSMTTGENVTQMMFLVALTCSAHS